MQTVASGSTTLSWLRAAVNEKLANYPLPASASATGDGVSAIWELPHANIVEDSLDSTVDDVAVTPTVDCAPGIATYDTAPATESEILVAYQYIRWSDDAVDAAINEAMLEIWGDLHQSYIDSTTITPASTTFRYELPLDCAYLFKVDYYADDSAPPTHVREWTVEETRDDEGTGELATTVHASYLILYKPEASGTYRLHYVKMMTELADDTDTLEVDAGFPTQAKWGIVWLACSHLIMQQLAQRVRSNRFYKRVTTCPRCTRFSVWLPTFGLYLSFRWSRSGVPRHSPTHKGGNHGCCRPCKPELVPEWRCGQLVRRRVPRWGQVHDRSHRRRPV
jgi:hypothetical protein